MDNICNFLVTYPLLTAGAEPVFCKERTRHWRNVAVCESSGCGAVDSVVEAGLVAGAAESPACSWAEPGLLGCGEVC